MTAQPGYSRVGHAGGHVAAECFELLDVWTYDGDQIKVTSGIAPGTTFELVGWASIDETTGLPVVIVDGPTLPHCRPGHLTSAWRPLLRVVRYGPPSPTHGRWAL